MFVYMYVTAATGRQPNCSKQINNNNVNNNIEHQLNSFYDELDLAERILVSGVVIW
jgi:hypothetical protein